jgi:hypothetical protein
MFLNQKKRKKEEKKKKKKRMITLKMMKVINEMQNIILQHLKIY